MAKTDNRWAYVTGGSLVLFVAFVSYILYINSDVLYTAHDRSEYFGGAYFFSQLAAQPFGIMQYAGAWLTQLYHYPALGASVLVALWCLIFWVGKKAFRLEKGAAALMLLPVACLLVSMVDLGYWIYVLNLRGYWFSQTLGYLVLLLLLWAAGGTSRLWHIVWFVVVLALYPVLGWFSLLFVLCLALSRKPDWVALCGVVMVLFAGNIWHSLAYSYMKLDDVLLAGFPRFETATDSLPRLTIPFWMLAGVSVVIASVGKYLKMWLLPVGYALVGMAMVWTMMYQDKNFTDEMRMIRCATDDDWEGVVAVAKENDTPSRTMVILKNIALMNTGELLSKSFKIGGNDGEEIHDPDSLNLNIMHIASPLVYYNYGKQNFGIRWGIENAVNVGYSPFYLKMLARMAVATGEKEMATRYTELLQSNLFYKDWKPAPPSKKIALFQELFLDVLDSDENSCERYLISIFSKAYDVDEIDLIEVALFYSMIYREPSRFWSALYNYGLQFKGKVLPLHVQEAYVMYRDKFPAENFPFEVKVNSTVEERYQRYWNMGVKYAKQGKNQQLIGEALREKWGDTYWWFNSFGRTAY